MDSTGAGLGFGFGGVVPSLYRPYTAPPVAPVPSPPPAPITMGIEPQAYEAILYGKVIPVIAGSPMLGFRIIEGPWWAGGSTAPTVSFIASAGMPANPAGTNVFTDIRLRGKSFAFDGAATIGNGSVRNLTDSSVAGATVEVRTGTETQLPFQSSIDRYGAMACAYRPHFLIELKNIPISAFGGIIPMPSGQIHNTTYGLTLDEGITRNNALTEFLGYMRLASTDFEVSVQGRDVAWIASEQQQLTAFLQNLRAEFVHWNITFRDKMRVIEPTTIPVEALLTPDNTLRASVKFTQADPLVQAREKIASFIDIDRDYEPNTASARADSFPIPTTLSVNSQTNNLPIVGHASEMEADVNVSLFEELASVDQITATVMPSVFGIEASDGFQYLDNTLSFTGRIVETQRDLSKFSVQVTGVEVLNCSGEADDEVGDIDGVTVSPDDDYPWLQIASLACTNNGLMCGSFFFRSVRELDTTTEVIWAADNYSSYLQTEYVNVNSDFLTGGLALTDPDTLETTDFIYANTSAFNRDVHHCVFSMDTSIGGDNNINVIYIDGVKVSTLDTVPVGPTSNAFTPLFNGKDFVLFSQVLGGSGSEFIGDIWRMWLAPGQKLHESDGTISSTTIDKFVTEDGRPRNLGSDGSTPTGTAPAIYFDGGSATFHTNRGTGGSFTQNGTFTTVPFPT